MDGKLRNMTSLYLTKDECILCLYRIGSRVANQMYIGSAGGHFESMNSMMPENACCGKLMKNWASWKKI